MAQALILTLRLDDRAFAVLDGLRRRHFPPERNLIPAHITLFHALPGEQERSISAALAAAVRATGPLPIVLPGVRFLGRGVALEVEAPKLRALRDALAGSWSPWLGAQDRQPYRPHVTVQNKVAPDVARSLYDELRLSWRPLEARGEGLLLWRYLGGPWELVEEHRFVDADVPED
jgi:2'-5' RNA ligase